MESIDPRVKRLPKLGQSHYSGERDQFGTFEVFVQPKTGKPFQHEGIVHAPDLEMAFVLAKEAFTRRFLCTSMYVVETQNIRVSPMTEANINAYELISDDGDFTGPEEDYEIYHLSKRGKQHVHAGTVRARNYDHALAVAKKTFAGTVVLNVWAIRRHHIRFTQPHEEDLWATLPEKKFRDASEYRGGEKLKEFLDRKKS